MTEMLTYSQQRSVLTRYTMEGEYGSYNQKTGKYANQYLIAHCKMCPPATPNEPISKHHKSFKSSWQKRWDGFYRLYAVDPRYSQGKDEDYARIRELYEHLEQAHSVAPCKICSECVTSRGLTRHQKAPDCQGELRRFYMREEGFEPLASGVPEMFTSIVQRKKAAMDKLIDWRDHEAYLQVERAAEDAARWFIINLGIRPAYTQWVKKAKEYQKEFWSPPGVSSFLNLARESIYEHDGSKDENFVSMLHQWLSGDDEMKDAILGILELQKDAK